MLSWGTGSKMETSWEELTKKLQKKKQEIFTGLVSSRTTMPRWSR